VLNYKEQYYAFSSREAAEEFALDPDLYVPSWSISVLQLFVEIGV